MEEGARGAATDQRAVGETEAPTIFGRCDDSAVVQRGDAIPIAGPEWDWILATAAGTCSWIQGKAARRGFRGSQWGSDVWEPISCGISGEKGVLLVRDAR